MKRTGIQRLGANTFYLHEGQAVVSFKSSPLQPGCEKGKIENVTIPGTNTQAEIMTWGKDNDLPQVMENLVSGNEIVPALMGTKQRILVGNGLMPHKVIYEKGKNGQMKRITEEVQMPEQVQNWLDGEGWGDGLNFWKYLDGAAGEFVKHSLIIPEFVRNKGGQIKSIEIKECKTMRAGKKVNGRVRSWYWSGHWAKRGNTSVKEEDKKIVKIDIYTGEEKKQAKFIIPAGDYLFNDGYYPRATWTGSKDWIEMANFIAPFHRANLKNGYNMRWHIEIPANYFLDYEKYNGAATDEEKAKLLADATAREQAFMDDINQFLAGIANAGRTVWTKFEWDQSTGKKYPGIEIKPITYDMKDESLLKLHESSLKAAISSQGLHPTLANIETQGKLASGTEIRNAFLMWLIINTPGARKMMLEPLNLVKKINQWPADIFYGIRDYELTALSSNGAGMQEREQPVAA